MENESERINDRDLLAIKAERRAFELFTEKQACEFLGISTITLWRARKARSINFRRLGGSIRYTAGDLEAYVERNLQAAIA